MMVFYVKIFDLNFLYILSIDLYLIVTSKQHCLLFNKFELFNSLKAKTLLTKFLSRCLDRFNNIIENLSNLIFLVISLKFLKLSLYLESKISCETTFSIKYK